MSFGHTDMLIKKYDELMADAHAKAIKKAHFIGFMYGFSQFAQNALFSALYYFMALFNVHFEASDPMDQFTAIFSIFYAAAAAGNAQQFGPDIGKATAAAKKIFGIIDTPTLTEIHDQRVDSSK
jgi:ABC-type multidrug transport system fused ATPase/permease subunit